MQQTARLPYAAPFVAKRVPKECAKRILRGERFAGFDKPVSLYME
jgi:hypothetical protein